MKLKSATFVNQTRATFSQLRTSAAVSTPNRILADAQEGNFIYFAKYFDTFYVKDGARPSDEMVFELFRYLADGEASILDDQELQFVKQRTDTAFIGDSIYIQRVYIRDFFHTAAAADDALFSVGKTLSDTSGMSDSKNVLTGKHIYDIPVAAETLAFAFSSARADSALLGDVNEVAFNKTLLELTSTADAGSLRSQGYADFTYFGEDFVGVSRTF